MPVINTASEFLEVNFTDAELNLAMQLKDMHMSQMYLQNLRVGYQRQILGLDFEKAGQEEEIVRQHAYLKGRIDMLRDLIDGIISPHAIPVNPDANIPATHSFNPAQ